MSDSSAFSPNAEGIATVVIEGVELSIHAARQATIRGLTIDAISNAMKNSEPFFYFQNGEKLMGYYHEASNVFVGVGERITTVISPRNG